MNMKTKNRLDRYYINRLTPTHRDKYTKYKVYQYDGGYMY